MNMEWGRLSGCLIVVGAMIVLILNPVKGKYGFYILSCIL